MTTTATTNRAPVEAERNHSMGYTGMGTKVKGRRGRRRVMLMLNVRERKCGSTCAVPPFCAVRGRGAPGGRSVEVLPHRAGWLRPNAPNVARWLLGGDARLNGARGDLHCLRIHVRPVVPPVLLADIGCAARRAHAAQPIHAFSRRPNISRRAAKEAPLLRSPHCDTDTAMAATAPRSLAPLFVRS